MIIKKTIYKRDLKEIVTININNINKYKLINIIYTMEKEYPKNIYIINNDNDILYIFTSLDILKIITNNLFDMKIEEYIKKFPKKIEYVYDDENPFSIYQIMRNKIDFIVVKDKSNNKLLGELEYKFISKKIYDMAIRDDKTNLYNEKFFDILLKKFVENNNNIGVILIRIKNLNILQQFYGDYFIQKILQETGTTIEHTIRRIDFAFKMKNNDFVIISLNNPLSIIVKIKERLKKNLNNIIIDNIKIEYLYSYSHYPEEENSVITVLDKCKYEINKLSYEN